MRGFNLIQKRNFLVASISEKTSPTTNCSNQYVQANIFLEQGTLCRLAPHLSSLSPLLLCRVDPPTISYKYKIRQKCKGKVRLCLEISQQSTLPPRTILKTSRSRSRRQRSPCLMKLKQNKLNRRESCQKRRWQKPDPVEIPVQTLDSVIVTAQMVRMD
jgi:hypothetical protein